MVINKSGEECKNLLRLSLQFFGEDGEDGDDDDFGDDFFDDDVSEDYESENEEDEDVDTDDGGADGGDPAEDADEEDKSGADSGDAEDNANAEDSNAGGAEGGALFSGHFLRPEAGVCLGGGLFQQAEGMDDLPGHRFPAHTDGEILNGALGLGAPVFVGGDFYLAHGVVFNAVFHTDSSFY